MMDWLISNFWPLALALMAFLKALGNLIPSEKPREVFAILDRIVNALVPDNIKKAE
jgi:hypothetical protein|tara:strand:- start:205 stop:372 length:168 start_codon:yes stop_codon:yes gene_type:complete